METMTNRYFNGQLARYYYRKGMVSECVGKLIIAEITWKNIGLFLTCWHSGLRSFVLKRFNVSGINGR